MQLKIFLPTHVLLHETVEKVIAEAETGELGLLPHHIDCVTALVPGILTFERNDGQLAYVAVDHGILVKCGDEVWVSSPRAVRGTDLETLHQTVRNEFERHDDRERRARSAIAKLEAGFLRGTYELGGPDG